MWVDEKIEPYDWWRRSYVFTDRYSKEEVASAFTHKKSALTNIYTVKALTMPVPGIAGGGTPFISPPYPRHPQTPHHQQPHPP